MLDFLDTLTSAQALAGAGIGLMFLAILARVDRISARNDRRLSEIDRNAAAELYRRATYERERDAEQRKRDHKLIGELHNELREVVALYEAREARRATSWERLGIVARNVG